MLKRNANNKNIMTRLDNISQMTYHEKSSQGLFQAPIALAVFIWKIEFINTFFRTKGCMGWKPKNILSFACTGPPETLILTSNINFLLPQLTPVLLLIEHSWYRIVKLRFTLALSALNAISYNFEYQKVRHCTEVLQHQDKEKQVKQNKR